MYVFIRKPCVSCSELSNIFYQIELNLVLFAWFESDCDKLMTNPLASTSVLGCEEITEVKRVNSVQ